MDSGAIENCVYLRCHGQPTLWLGVASRPRAHRGAELYLVT